MKTVLFDSRSWVLNVGAAIHSYFQENTVFNIRPVTVYHNKLDHKQFSHLQNRELLLDFYDEGINKYSKDNLLEIEKKYNLINLWNVVFFDRFLYNKKRDFILKQISFFVFAWEKILEKHKPDFVVTEPVTGLWNYILYALVRHHGGHYLGAVPTKNTNKYFFTRDLYIGFPEMEKKFLDLKSRALKESERELALSFVQKFKEKHMVPSYMKSTTALPKIYNFFNPYRVPINIYKDIKLFLNRKGDYTIDYRFSGYKRDALRIRRILYTKVFNIFEQPKDGDKYILYPLHYQPEATTDICAAYHRDQFNVIKNIARSIPIDHCLYVKEHSAVLGSRSTRFYERLKQIPNLKIIDPWTSISDLIKNAKAIAVLTGTTALEGIFWKKPVIMFGKVFFDIYPYIHKVKSLEELPEIINVALNNARIDDDIYLKYVYSYVSSGYDGSFLRFKGTPEEIETLCSELITETAR